MDESNNTIRLRGEMVSLPVYSHAGRFEKFYTFPLSVLRLSGTADTVNVTVRESLLQTEITAGDKICVEGEVHSYNNKSGTGNKLVISVLAKSIAVCDGDDYNTVELYGTLCKNPNYRITPMGRDICDMMVAVNRRYGRSDYLPCIAWGSLAHTASALSVGQRVHIKGRLQSRDYIKSVDGVPVQKTAYEISASELTAE